MSQFVVVEKSGSIKEVKIKSVNESEFYKKAGFKSDSHFKLQTEWNVEVNNKKYNVCLYGKTEGRAGQENKYDFPPPVDNMLFFGNCLLVNKKNKEFTSLFPEEWKQIYNHLFQGFEDIGEEDSEEEEDDEDENIPKTKDGYAKDGFVVDEEEEEEEEEDEEEEEEEDVELEDDDDEELEDDDDDMEDADDEPEKPAAKTRKSKRIQKKQSENTIFHFDTEENEELDYTSELEEEDYV